MKELPIETTLEFKCRVEGITSAIESAHNAFKKGAVHLKRKSFSYNYIAGSYFSRSLLYRFLNKTELANDDLQKVLPELIKAREYESSNEVYYNEYLTFTYCFYINNEVQLTITAEDILKRGISESRCSAPSEFYLMLANLWLGKKDIAQQLLPNIERFEKKKNEKFVTSGFVMALQGILNKDVSLAVNGIEELLKAHIHESRYMRTALREGNLVCIQATILCIIALKYGMDLKAEISSSITVLKTKMDSPLDRPEIPEKTKFEVPVDLIPEWMITPWRETFTNK